MSLVLTSRTTRLSTPAPSRHRPDAEAVLRDLAFVYRMTERVKADLVCGKTFTNRGRPVSS